MLNNSEKSMSTNDTEDRKHISTLLKLIAPDSVEVELVPLSSIEKVEFLFFWVTIFLTVWGTVLGTYLSLITTDFNNKPVILLLEVCLGFLSILVIAFSITAFNVRAKSRRKAKTEPQTPDSSEKADRIIRFIANGLPDQFSEIEFKALVNEFDDRDNDTDLQHYLFTRAINRKLIKEYSGNGGEKKYRRASE